MVQSEDEWSRRKEITSETSGEHHHSHRCVSHRLVPPSSGDHPGCSSSKKTNKRVTGLSTRTRPSSTRWRWNQIRHPRWNRPQPHNRSHPSRQSEDVHRS
ncbi:hypothetical protein BLNAU_19620 [Blattamonas nauphoetae]|uniref:Uncharacterized protein n=1 Tax=Blattamonas nauphoetae TaxID=2049346 RepID=A0ABQ9X1J7_9EUKA|nr:hypothetical protein BLNAU_19620 [Blattamonas nauphoetae]